MASEDAGPPHGTPPAAAGGTVASRSVALERDGFLQALIGELAGTLQDVVGVEDSAGFVSVVGQRMGRHIGRGYRDALGGGPLDREQVAQVLVDLKRRIGGGFSVIEQDDGKIVLGNRACPFAQQVVGRPALCMMTSNVFGSIAADDLGYAKVSIDEAIARGDAGCRVTVWLRRSEESIGAEGREYFSDPLPGALVAVHADAVPHDDAPPVGGGADGGPGHRH